MTDWPKTEGWWEEVLGIRRKKKMCTGITQAGVWSHNGGRRCLGPRKEVSTSGSKRLEMLVRDSGGLLGEVGIAW